LSTCSGCHNRDTHTPFQMVRTRGRNNEAFFAKFMVGDSGGPLVVKDSEKNNEQHEFFDLKAREEIVRDILSVAQQVDSARLRLNRTELNPNQSNQAHAQVFVQGGVVGDWEYALPSGNKDNRFFTLNSSTGDLSLNTTSNTQPNGALQILVRATATDGTGMVLERPYSLWIMGPDDSKMAQDLDTSIQLLEVPPLATPRPNRTH